MRREKICIYYIYSGDKIPDKDSPIVLLYNTDILVEELVLQVEKYSNIVERESELLEKLKELRRKFGLETTSLEDLFARIDEKHRLAREALRERLKIHVREHVVDVEDRSGKYPRYSREKEDKGRD